MKKIAAGFLALLMLTGCSNKDDEQTLFVSNNKNKYALVNYDGEKQTKFIYDNYEVVGTKGYIVIKDDKYGYILEDGSEKIKLGKYDKLEVISDMVVGFKGEELTLFDGDGEVLCKEDKKVKIELSGLAIVVDKKYTVYYGSGEILISSKNKIVSAYIIDDEYIVVNYEKKSELYNVVNNQKLDKVDLGGDYQLMDYSSKKGYLLYNRTSHDIRAVNLEGKIILSANLELDDLYYDSSNNVVGIKNQTTYLFDNDGNSITCNSYYRNYKNYVVKNKDLIYGPHQFVNDGKVNEVNGIQLDPLASYTKANLFPVYVRDTGYQYYTFKGEKAFKTVFASAKTFDKNKLAIVSKDNESFYLIDTSGDKVSKKYESIEYIDSGYYAGYINSSKYEVINTKGKKVIDDYFMGDATVFTYLDKTYGIFNKSGSSYIYDLEEYEVLFNVEGVLEFNDSGYFVSDDGSAYYSMKGEKIYKR